MNITTQQESLFFKALSEQIRLRIMVLLTEGELCVCDLTETLTLPQSSVSRHMSKLKSSNLIKDRRDGKWVFYSLNDDLNELIPSLTEILHSFRERDAYKIDLATLKSHLQTKNCSQE